ncbi:hypothetical protein D9756_003906 [Leucocoprinus leucothites]|uniref:Uncharacterized protein n=1 Tax=Leucocoprinus leucothites TaxID=201217 RepID=A0A8H5DBN0_9AGAR|nr:hypothetical protein D9756_003906 [Leucoagaricus leucothites]
MLHLPTNCWRRGFGRHSFAKQSTVRFKSSYVLRSPPRTAPRESPTPLVFVSAKAWDTDSEQGMTTLSSMLAEQGFTCLQTDLALPDPQTRNNSASMMKWFENELRSAVRLSMIPFPPVVFARSAGCLIAQTYISSNPATGLVLLSPPANNVEMASTHCQYGLPILPTHLAEFDFEPNFPIAVMATLARMRVLEKLNRLTRDSQVDMFTVDSLEGQQAYNNIQNWLDKLGI